MQIASPFLGETRERYLKAEALAAAERWEEALPWFGSFAEFWVYDAPYLAPSHFRTAQIYERLGRKNEAAQEYAIFIEMWQDADPELQPLVRQARERLLALTSSATSPRK